MSADFSALSTSTSYLTILTQISDRDRDLAVGLDPAVVTPTNLPTNAIRYNSANKRWEKYNGTSWVELIASATDAYAITVTGVRSGQFYGTITNNGSISGGTVDATTLKRGGNTVWDSANLSNVSQLTNDAGYIGPAGNTTGSAGSLSVFGLSTLDANADRGAGARTVVNSTSSTNWPGTFGVAFEARRSAAGSSSPGTFQLWSANATDEDLRFRKVTAYAGSETWGSWRTLMHDGNVGTYALPIGGGNVTGTLTVATNMVLRHTTPSANTAWLSTPSYSATGDGRTHFGYLTGGVYNNYLRGTGATVVDTPSTIINGNVGVNVAPDVVSNYKGITLLDTTGSFLHLKSTTNAVNATLSADGTASAAIFGTTSNHHVQFWANNAEKARLLANGNLLVGTTTDAGANYRMNVGGGGINLAGQVRATGANELVRLVNDGAYISFWNSAESDRTGYLQATDEGAMILMHEDAGGSLQFGAQSVVRWALDSSALYPALNNTYNLGGGVNRVATVFASNFNGVTLDIQGAGSYISVARGATADPYGTVGVTRPADANAYSYYGLTRAGQMGAGIGINSSNQIVIGGATSGGDGVVNSPFITLSGAGAAFPAALSTVGPASLGPASTVNHGASFGAAQVGYKKVPVILTAGGTAAADVVGAAYHTTGNITINGGVFADGDVFGIVNVGTGSISVIVGAGFSLFKPGSTSSGNATLSVNGVATVVIKGGTSGAQGIILGGGVL